MASPTNVVLMRLPKRAESSGREELIRTFVDVGPLFTLLSSLDHQIVYGRRGTGKTHALAYLSSTREDAGDLVAYVDLRNIGSSGGIYADSTRSLSERAACLLVDTLSAIHESLYDRVLKDSEDFDLGQIGPALDALAHAITEVRVVGSVEAESTREASASEAKSVAVTGKTSATGVGASAEVKASAETRAAATQRLRRSGTEQLYVNFGSTGAAIRRLAEIVGRRVWVLLDEWSSLPLALQPYLADLLRRSVFPVTGITVKIAAIEQRSIFQLRLEQGDYVGIEIGADASADVNLDDFMVFDNDPDRAKQFFRDLISRHASAVAATEGDASQVSPLPEELVRQAFTQNRAFEEFVRASEGVPRDAINILALAATRALNETISVEHIRSSAKNWYQRDKDKAVSANDSAHRLLPGLSTRS